MGTYKLGVLEGDGIGPEVVSAAVAVLRAAADRQGDVGFELVPHPIGWAAIKAHGTATPERTIEALRDCDGWILGPHDSASYPPAERAKLNPSGQLRKRFDLYANLRPAIAYQRLPSLSPRMDLVIARENTEGFYADRNMAVGSGEFMPTPDVAIMMGLVTRRASERIARVAFELARARRKRVTIVHKANVLALTTGLFRDVCREVARQFPDVGCEDLHVDAATALLVRQGADFDVLVTENMFGDILSDLTGELAGSLGMAGSVNAGDETAMAQAAHGAAPTIAGRKIANPIGMIVSVALLIGWLGSKRNDPALGGVHDRIQAAVAATLAGGEVRTPDIGGSATTDELAAAIAANC